MNAPTFTSTGTKATSPQKLAKEVFEVTPKNHELLKSAYVSYLSNGRVNLAKTKTRGLVSGGGRKPWRQKGTGRARTGSSRNPIWRGGGIVFGPTGNENYMKRLNVKTKRLALRQALSLAAQGSKISVIEDFKLKNAKSSEIVSLLNKLKVTGYSLLVIDKADPKLSLAARNLTASEVITSSSLSVVDILNADSIVLTKPALKALEERLGGSHE